MPYHNKQFSIEIPLDESQRHKVIWTDSEGNPTLSKETDSIIREVYSISPDCKIGCEIVNYSVGGLFLKVRCDGSIGFLRINDLMFRIEPIERTFIKSANKK